MEVGNALFTVAFGGLGMTVVASLVAAARVVRRIQLRSREIHDQITDIGRSMASLQSSVVSLESAQSRLDGEVGDRLSQMQGRVDGLVETLEELGTIERALAEVSRSAAEGKLPPETADKLVGHFKELTADTTTESDRES
jgi:hypothetical protein